MIRLRSLRKNAHSSLRFLLILGMAAPFCRFYRGNGIGGVWCMVSVSFSGIFPSVCPLKKAGGIADRARYRGRFCAVSVSFGVRFQRPIFHSKGVCRMEAPFRRGWNKTEHPYRSQSRRTSFVRSCRSMAARLDLTFCSSAALAFCSRYSV